MSLEGIRQLAQRILGWLPWFRPTAVEPAPIASALIDLSPDPASMPTPRKKREKKADDGDFLHFTEVLNLLPKCRQLIKPLRRIDNDAFQFWKELGAKLVSYDMDLDAVKIPTKVETMPGRGMIFHPYMGDTKKYFPGQFTYFDKLNEAPHDVVVPRDARGQYSVTCAFTDHDNKAFGYTYVVALFGPDRTPSAVPERFSHSQHLPRGGTIHHTRWGINPTLRKHFRDFLRDNPKTTIKTAEQFGGVLFILALQEHARTADDFQVRAERDGISVAFNVALGRTPQFFKDRETGAATDGRRKRIFHAVAEHERTYPSGKTVTVPAHYRGERQFLWNGEAITITPSERSFAKTFTLGAYRVDEGDVAPKNLVALTAARGRKLREASEGEWRKGLRSSSRGN